MRYEGNDLQRLSHNVPTILPNRQHLIVPRAKYVRRCVTHEHSRVAIKV
jgi:hypothetical protein